MRTGTAVVVRTHTYQTTHDSWVHDSPRPFSSSFSLRLGGSSWRCIPASFVRFQTHRTSGRDDVRDRLVNVVHCGGCRRMSRRPASCPPHCLRPTTLRRTRVGCSVTVNGFLQYQRAASRCVSSRVPSSSSWIGCTNRGKIEDAARLLLARAMGHRLRRLGGGRAPYRQGHVRGAVQGFTEQ